MRITEFQPTNRPKPTDRPIDWKPVLERLEGNLEAAQAEIAESLATLNEIWEELTAIDAETEA